MCKQFLLSAGLIATLIANPSAFGQATQENPDDIPRQR